MTENDDKKAGHGAALARKALERLLARAENAASKGAAQTDRTGRTVTLPLSEKSFPEYLRLQRYADKAVCNANLQLAERDGAIRVEWDSRAGERAQILRIVLRDGTRLAVASRTIIWPLVKQMRMGLMPVFHCLQRRLALQG